MILDANQPVIYVLNKRNWSLFMSSVGITAVINGRESKKNTTHIDLMKSGTAMLRMLPTNLAHKCAIQALKFGLIPKLNVIDDPILKIRLWDMEFDNPIGMSAGFDKNAEVIKGVSNLGFGFAEIGTVTPFPQKGNPKPNLFRLPEDRALINHLGFPSKGAENFAINLDKAKKLPSFKLGINIGINTGTSDATGDIDFCLKRLARYASYIAINVSCPNTPGLSAWQVGDKLSEMVEKAKLTLSRPSNKKSPPLLVKIGQELDDKELAGIAKVALNTGIDGLVACNTTGQRPAALRSSFANEVGGLSGSPIRKKANQTLSKLYKMTNGKVVLIGCGGISTADDAYERIKSGASLLQLYTSLIYGGPGLIAEIKEGLLAHLKDDGYTKLSDAVGANHR